MDLAMIDMPRAEARARYIEYRDSVRERLKWRIAGALRRSVEDLFPAFQLRPPPPAAEPADKPEEVAS